MSEAAFSFDDAGMSRQAQRDAAASLSRVRERIMETSEKLTGTNSGIRKKKYKRKQIPETEKEKRRLQLIREAEYLQIMKEAKGGSALSIWSFENLFPAPVWDESCIKRDLYEIRDQDQQTLSKKLNKGGRNAARPTGTRPGPAVPFKTSSSSSTFQLWRKPELSSSRLPYDPPAAVSSKSSSKPSAAAGSLGILSIQPIWARSNSTLAGGKVDRDMTRMVEDKIYGYRRTQAGQFQYETSLMGDGAVKFRDGVRLGNPLRINADRLTYLAKKEFQHGRIEEAKELYEKAVETDPRDGRGYLGLSRCAERRRDFTLARDWLRLGIQNSVSTLSDTYPDMGGNPFLLQALGRLEEKRGNLAEAESLYTQAARSRPSHAAAWVALAQLRTRKLGHTVAAGRICYETAERELKKAGQKPNAHVYTAWASLEYKGAGDARRARQLFQCALEVDPKCSAAWLQLGVMEADNENWQAAQDCFETVLKFDQRNSRVIQAYAIMETKRPNGSSRKAIDLFERGLKVNPRDAGVLQPYALYVAELGDIEAAREL
jgi:tetratricopeptide (TPR) repeat protein